MNPFSSVGNLPTIQTRTALLLLDFQNDFVRPSGGLPVPNTADFLDRLPQLAQAFRRAGDVIWVRSHFEAPRPVVDLDYYTDRLVLNLNLNLNHQPHPEDQDGPVDEEAFLSSDPPKCCQPKSTGFQFPAPILAAIDPDRDTVLDKSDYSAFQSEGLVLSFRNRFVTKIYICGSLSNVSVYATVLDAVQYGLSVTLIEDCLGYRSFPRHEEAMRRMADMLGANGITTDELYEELDWQETDAIARKGGPKPVRSVTPAGIEGVMDGLDVTARPGAVARADVEDDDGNPPVDLSTAKFTRTRYLSSATDARSGGSGDNKVRARIRRSKRNDPRPESASQAQRRSKPKATEKTLGPKDSIGEGDSRILYDLDLPVDSFAQLRDEVAWQKMYHLSGQVPRLVAVQGRPLPDGSIPIYRHPADESPPLLPFTPTVDQIRVMVERILGHPLNHVLIQLYRDGEDRISEHADKTLDIVRGSFICNVSLGAQRVMVLRTKTAASKPDETDTGRQTQRIPLPHESLFILGEKTNMRWLHGIRPDKRPESAKSADERAYGGQRISLTFRHIGTFVDATESTIWGQGAVAKSQDQARRVIHGDPVETERLIRAFGQQNHASEFDWDAVYGGGFDVVNFVTTTPTRLVPSGDPVADLRVRLCLSENGFRYEVTVCSERDADNGLPLYVDTDGTCVAGDVNIITYLANRPREATRLGVEMLQGGDQLAEIEQLLADWRKYQTSDSEGEFHSLDGWESALEGRNYLKGSSFGIDDCSLWPVIRDIVQKTGLISATSHPNLHHYYHRVEKRGCVKVVLEEMN